MTFLDIAAGLAIFIDTNTFVYYFGYHPVFGLACRQLFERIDRKELQGYTSAHVVNELVHRLMATEAGTLFGWPVQGIARRLKRHPTEAQQLSHYRQAIDEISLLGIQVLPATAQLVSLAADVIQQTGLLSSDALSIEQRCPNCCHDARPWSDQPRQQ